MGTGHLRRVGVFPAVGSWPYHLLLLVTVSAAALTVLTTIVDGMWDKTPGGLARRYDVFILFTTAPLLLLLARPVTRAFVAVIGAPVEFDRSDRQTRVAIVSAKRLFRTPQVRLFTLATIFIGALATVANAAGAVRPEAMFGYDVFDSWHHPRAFALMRLYLALLWCFALPLAVCLLFGVTMALHNILRVAERNRAVVFQWHGKDECAGMARLGSVIYGLQGLVLVTAAPGIAIGIQHDRLGAAAGMIILSLAGTAAITIFLLVPVHRLVAKAKVDRLHHLSKVADAAEVAGDYATLSSVLAVRTEVAAVSTFALPVGRATIAVVAVIIQIVLSVFALVPFK